MGGYVFDYLRADGEEKMIGPFADEKEAQTKRDRMVSFGALCSPVFPTTDGPKAKKDNYTEQKIDEFRDYFKAEMKLISQEGVSYWISYEFLETAIFRIKLFVSKNDPYSSAFADTIATKDSCSKDHYRLTVAQIIDDEGDSYGPMEGSFWESYSQLLKELATEIRKGEIKDDIPSYKEGLHKRLQRYGQEA